MTLTFGSACGRMWITALCLALAACSAVKAPPGWPGGEARPINATPPSKAQR